MFLKTPQDVMPIFHSMLESPLAVVKHIECINEVT